MKMSADRFRLLRDTMQRVYDQRNQAAYDAFYANLSTMRKLWDLLYESIFDLQYDDSHPYYCSPTYGTGNVGKCGILNALNLITEDRKRKRVSPHVPKFDIYDGGLNDSHLATALKRIAQDLKIS